MDKFKRLYITINEMLAVLGAEGHINTKHPTVDDVMDALFDLDDGEYKVERVFPECVK